MTRSHLEHKYREHRIIVQNNVGPRSQGRYSIEVRDSLTVICTCNTLDEAESRILDWIELRKEMADEDAELDTL